MVWCPCCAQAVRVICVTCCVAPQHGWWGTMHPRGRVIPFATALPPEVGIPLQGSGCRRVAYTLSHKSFGVIVMVVLVGIGGGAGLWWWARVVVGVRASREPRWGLATVEPGTSITNLSVIIAVIFPTRHLKYIATHVAPFAFPGLRAKVITASLLGQN
jgi:hypothetical protein